MVRQHGVVGEAQEHGLRVALGLTAGGRIESAQQERFGERAAREIAAGIAAGGLLVSAPFAAFGFAPSPSAMLRIPEGGRCAMTGAQPARKTC